MVDRTRLESGLTFTGNGSSNLPLSASLLKMSFGACPQLDPFSNSGQVLSGGHPENLFVYSPIAMLPVAEAICKTGFAGGDPFVNPPGQWGPMLAISKYGRTTSTGRKSSRSSRKSTFVRGVAQPLQSVILVADDEALFLNSVTMMLQRQGYIVLSASDGVEALDLSRRREGSIDLVVTDVAMPRMNGIDLVAHLMEERPGIKVLLISGTNMRRGVSPDWGLAFLPKPFDGQTLMAKIRTLLATPV